MLDTRNDVHTAEQANDTAPLVDPIASAARPQRRGLFDQVSGVDAVFLTLFWLLAPMLLMAIAPAPDPTATQPPLNVAVNVTWNIGFIAALGGAVTRRRLSLFGTVVAGGAMALMATFCGLEGHTGLWIPAQFLMGAGIAAYGINRLRG